MLHARKGHHHALRPVEELPVHEDGVPVNVRQALLGAQQRVAERVVLVGGRVHQLGQDQLGLAPDLADLVPRRLELVRHLVVGDVRVADRLGEELDRRRHGVVERRRLVHHRLARRCALDVASERLHLLEHVVGRPLRRRLEREPVHDVGYAPERFVFEPGAAFDVDADAREGSRERL